MPPCGLAKGVFPAGGGGARVPRGHLGPPVAPTPQEARRGRPAPRAPALAEIRRGRPRDALRLPAARSSRRWRPSPRRTTGSTSPRYASSGASAHSHCGHRELHHRRALQGLQLQTRTTTFRAPTPRQSATRGAPTVSATGRAAATVASCSRTSYASARTARRTRPSNTRSAAAPRSPTTSRSRMRTEYRDKPERGRWSRIWPTTTSWMKMSLPCALGHWGRALCGWVDESPVIQRRRRTVPKH